MRVGIYCRVSTEEQAKQGYSLESQLDECMKFIQAHNYELYKVYTDDGYSAKNMKRPALQEMLEDIRRRKLDLVLFWRLDRLSRNSREGQYMIYDIMEKYGVGFKSMTEQYDTSTAQGRMVLGIMLSIAQGERETIAERVRAGQEKKFLSGKRHGAMAAYGYELVDGELMVNEEEAEVVRLIYSLYQQNFGILAVTGYLNEKNIGGKRWNYTAVYYILGNPLYCGKIRWNYRHFGRYTKKEIILQGDHEPIISEEEYNRVQAIRKMRNKKGKAATSQYPFSGIAYCHRCGYPLVGNSRKQKYGTRRFYRCSGRYNYGKCDLPLIGEKEIETAFFKLFDVPKKELKSMIKLNERREKTDQKREAERLQRELAAVQARRKKWQMAYAADAITIDELRQYNEIERKKEQEIKEKLADLPNQKAEYSTEEIIDSLAELIKIWNEIDDDAAKKNFLHDLFRSIYIDTKDQPPRGNAKKLTVDIVKWDIY